ncbi:MAG TPA: Rieske (2Fe-2S) protein [Bacteroidia bacterium]|jgi:cytochrome b6-f complex iron-sulfur subunit|nr:Rieske (2Fe-2S) protein [Bacteroidia bacterium]
MERRDFIQKSFILACGVAGASAFLEACQKSNTTPAAPSVNFTIDISSSQYSALQKNGGSVYYSASNIIIARDYAGNFIALYDLCPHAGCAVQFDGTSKFPCPCHGSLFDENGNVLQGPATSGLKKYTASLTGTQLHVYG